MLSLRKERERELRDVKRQGVDDLEMTKTKLREIIVVESIRAKRVTRRTDLQGIFIALSLTGENKSKDHDAGKHCKDRKHRLNGTGFKTLCKLARDVMIDLDASKKKKKRSTQNRQHRTKKGLI